MEIKPLDLKRNWQLGNYMQLSDIVLQHDLRYQGTSNTGLLAIDPNQTSTKASWNPPFNGFQEFHLEKSLHFIVWKVGIY